MTIPVTQIVKVVPGVLAAAALSLPVSLTGLMLTHSTEVPIGSVVPFSSAAAVGAYFGLSSPEYAWAQVYFSGYNNALQTPFTLKFAQFNPVPVAAYLRGASLATMTLAQLQALTGTIIITIDGAQHTSSTINLSGATSFSNAATIINTALAAADATVTGAIAPLTGTGVGSISANQMAVATAPTSVFIGVGTAISGSGVSAATVTAQLSGTPGGAGVYTVSVSQTVAAGSTISFANGTLTVSAVATGAIAVGQVLSGTGVTVGTTVLSLGTGTGGTGTYQVTPSQTASSTTITASASTVTFDSVQQAFVITSGTVGPGSTIGYASGTLADALNLRALDGAVISLGAAVLGANAQMSYLYSLDQNWSQFTTIFEPSTGGKVNLSSWANSTGDQIGYIMWDSDSAPTAANDTTSAGYQIRQAGNSGTVPLYDPFGNMTAALALSIPACYEFTAQNGRATFAFRSQSGLSPTVTDATTAANLIANGYNYYGAYGLNGQQLPQNIIYPGSITGPFLWADSYFNQIWLNSSFTASLFALMLSAGFIPYNADGYGLVNASLLDPIDAGVNFGAIVAGVVLSQAEAAQVNNDAGAQISSIIQTQGWYLKVADPGATARAQRASPVIQFWYTDGESIQSFNMSSILII